ncbi:hypothetical protein WR25_25652 [Diploscapter pachys]|uniref:Guanylate cyclase n=1 Tax=Diploscapter pachys TaxID=2018661 RepID=A0A2A2KL42_9BILA|nr:hypothetical protein WR25_25652 [Diploscapter pachys]
MQIRFYENVYRKSTINFVVTSIFCSVMGKIVVTRFFFDYPIVILMIQTASTLMLIEMLRVIGILKIAPYAFEKGRQVFLPSVLLSIANWLTVSSFEGVGMPAFDAVKRFTPIAILLVVGIYKKRSDGSQPIISDTQRQYNEVSFMTAIFVSITAYFAVNFDMSIDRFSVFYGLIACACQGIAYGLFEQHSKTYKPSELLYMHSFNALIVYLTADIVQDEIRDAFMYMLTTAHPLFVFVFIVLVIASILFQYFAFHCIATNGALHTQIVSNIRASIQIRVVFTRNPPDTFDNCPIFPTLSPINQCSFPGWTTEVVKMLADALHWDIEAVISPNVVGSLDWGTFQENGTWSGVLGYLENGTADTACLMYQMTGSLILNIIVMLLITKAEHSMGKRKHFDAYETAWSVIQLQLDERNEDANYYTLAGNITLFLFALLQAGLMIYLYEGLLLTSLLKQGEANPFQAFLFKLKKISSNLGRRRYFDSLRNSNESHFVKLREATRNNPVVEVGSVDEALDYVESGPYIYPIQEDSLAMQISKQRCNLVYVSQAWNEMIVLQQTFIQRTFTKYFLSGYKLEELPKCDTSDYDVDVISKPLDINKTVGIFTLGALGIAISLIAFVAEIYYYWHKRIVSRRLKTKKALDVMAIMDIARIHFTTHESYDKLDILKLIDAMEKRRSLPHINEITKESQTITNETDKDKKHLLKKKLSSIKEMIKIGHIGAVGAMKNSEKILELSRNQLIHDGVLDTDLEFDIVTQMGCGESFEGVAVGADMYHVQKVRAFIGPYCNSELDAVAKMAAYWNVPIIGYMASSNIFADKAIYKTLARVSLRTTNSLAEAVAALIKHYGWNKVGIATNTGSLAFERTTAFEEVFHARGIQIMKKVMFDEYADTKGIVNSGLLSELANSCRIILCAFSATRDMSKEFMQAVWMSNMNTNEFVYLLPWLQTETKDLAPWIDDEGRTQQNIKQHFSNAFIIDDVNGFDDTLVTPFRERIEANGMTVDDLEMKNLYGYTHLYDALRLYALAVRRSMNETDNPDIYLDGKFIWNQMRRMTFPGLVSAAGVSSGTVMMDDVAERAPVYAAFYIQANSDSVKKVNEIEPHLIENCDGLKTKTGCYDLTITDLTTGYWPSLDGSLPKDEPACGFRNENENRALAKTLWRIYRDDFRIISEDEVKSMLSIGSTRTKLSNMSSFVKHHAVLGTNTHCSFHSYPQRRPIVFNRIDIKLLTQMKQAVHDNLNPFLGMSFNEKEEMDIIYNDDVVLDQKFHAAFIRDITLGLEYLHSSIIGYHGSLTPWACLIDRNWMVKLTDYGIANPLERWEKLGLIQTETLKDGNDKSGSYQRTSIIYQPPEILKNREANRIRRVDQTWIKQSMLRRTMGDIYSFGMVMYEIIFRSLPFPNGTNVNGKSTREEKEDTIEEILEYIQDGTKTFKPTIQDKSQMHPDLCALLLDCWNENPEVRPSIRRVRLNTESYLKVKGSLVDQMMRMMENYANNLEKLVQERTGMLEEANVRADKLLSQLLPKYVANELKMGRSVSPKTFTSATVMFSDIVGFTSICSSSTPLEVVTMLNSIYSQFDDVINKHEAYKVETIGDAYMIVSGIPEENGNKHIMKICSTGLDIMKLLETYEIPHRRGTKLKIRLGIHSGPVATGVVGLTAPRYCLFGDTVNVASRMESTGEPEKIQISEQSKDLVERYFPYFIIKKRGSVEVKGKGSCTTYWLEGRIPKNDLTNQPSTSQTSASASATPVPSYLLGV